MHEGDLGARGQIAAQRGRDPQRPERVDLELSANAVDVELVDAVTPDQDAGIVDEQVEPALADGFRQRLQAVVLADVDARDHLCGGVAQLLRGFAADRNDVELAVQ
jgi:hypothetical protein